MPRRTFQAGGIILHFVCKQDGITDRQTKERMDIQMDDPITRCPQQTFQAGGIKIWEDS